MTSKETNDKSNLDIEQKIQSILDDAKNNTTSKDPITYIVWLIEGINIFQKTDGKLGNNIEQVKQYVVSNIVRLIEAEVEKAKQSSYLDGLEAGIEMTMKRYNIPQTIINVREN